MNQKLNRHYVDKEGVHYKKKKKRFAINRGIAIKLSFEEEMAKNEANKQALRDFALSGTQESQTSIARPAVNANNFEIKPSLIQMVQ